MSGAALVVSVVDTCTGEQHLVRVEALALHRRSGRYPALCGTVVPAASLKTPPSRHCPNCAKQNRGEHRAAPRRQQLRRSGARLWWLWPWGGAVRTMHDRVLTAITTIRVACDMRDRNPTLFLFLHRVSQTCQAVYPHFLTGCRLTSQSGKIW